MAQVSDIGIDLGTSNVVIFMKGRGIVFREPSYVAVDRETRSILAFGTEAYRMIGRTPANVNVIRPLAQGEMLDFDLTSEMLRYFVSSVIGKRLIGKPRAVMAVPSGVKDMEKKALISAMFDAGVRRTQLLDKNIAAALGAQANFMGPYGALVVDISAGCTDLAVLYNSSLSVISSVRVGGDHFNEAIIRYLRKKYNMLLGERTAEQIKITLGGAIRREPRVEMDITGRNLITGLPKVMRITSDEINEALDEPLHALLESIQAVLERTPSELLADIFETGITLTGGGAQMSGLSDAVSMALKVDCQVADNPQECVARGCGLTLENWSEYSQFLSDRRRRR